LQVRNRINPSYRQTKRLHLPTRFEREPEDNLNSLQQGWPNKQINTDDDTQVNAPENLQFIGKYEIA